MNRQTTCSKKNTHLIHIFLEVQGKISRGYTLDRPEKCRRAGTGEDFPRIYPWPAGKAPPRGYREGFRAYIPVASRKNAAARVQEKICREYTRGLPEKRCRAGTEKDFPRIYPRPAGKTLPRGYRRRFPANIPVASRKNTAARVQEKISREYTRGRPEKHRRAGTGEISARIYPWPAGKTTPRGYREGFPREYTRDLPEKRHRAGTGEDFPRIYPWPAGKSPPRGYRERFSADIPEAERKSTAARVQEKISREYTRALPEKCRRAGTGKDSARIYPRPAGKMPPRGYRRRFPADVPVASRKNIAARVQEKISRGYTREHEKTSTA